MKLNCLEIQSYVTIMHQPVTVSSTTTRFNPYFAWYKLYVSISDNTSQSRDYVNLVGVLQNALFLHAFATCV